MDLLAAADSHALAGDSTPGTLRQIAGGVGRNIAENLARLGIQTSLASSVGDDSFGLLSMAQAQSAGIEISDVQVSRQFPTASYTAVHNSDGELLVAVSDMRMFDQWDIDLHDGLQKKIQQADAVVIDANLPEPVINKIVQSCKPHSVVADTVSSKKSKRLGAVLASLALLKVNRLEACALTNCESSTSDNELIQALLQRGVRQVLLTKGVEGATLAGNEFSIDMAAPQVSKVVSTNGAGDALLSGVLAAQLYGFDKNEQLRWGMLAAAHSLGVDSACADSLNYDAMKDKTDGINITNE